MYDTAKRSLAFTVATGGLLLAGAGYTPVQAASGQGPAPDPAPGAGSAAQSTVQGSGGLLSGNTLQIPLNLGLNLCGNQVAAAAAEDTVHGTKCAETGGASAVSGTAHSGGVLSGNTLQVPVSIPVNLCGNQVVAAGEGNVAAGAKCATGGRASSGAHAASVTDRSGGLVSGNTFQAPVSVPIELCGNQAVVAGVENLVAGAHCSGGSRPGRESGGGATATSVTVRSGGALSGNTVQTPITVPVEICGNQVAVASVHDGVFGTVCEAPAGPGTAAKSVTIGSGGLVSGNTFAVPIDVPVDICNLQVAAVTKKLKDSDGVCVSGRMIPPAPLQGPPPPPPPFTPPTTPPTSPTTPPTSPTTPPVSPTTTVPTTPGTPPSPPVHPNAPLPPAPHSSAPTPPCTPVPATTGGAMAALGAGGAALASLSPRRRSRRKAKS
jgi:hypothetical protein